jgi:hypothetical protein
MFSVFTEFMLAYKITPVYRTSVPTSQAMAIRKTEWLIVVETSTLAPVRKPEAVAAVQKFS